jgi:hypothetical protein
MVTWSDTSTGSGTPTGTVRVTVSGALGCSAPVEDGQCTVTTNTTGWKTIRAAYQGDAAFKASTSPGVIHRVTR